VTHQTVAVTGATGFVGRHVVRALTESGRRVRALARDLGKAGRVLPADERVEVVTGDVCDASVTDELCAGADAVVHLVGIRREKRPTATFERLHVDATRTALESAKRAGAGRYVQMSALGARPAARSEYHRTKYAAEELVRGSGLGWTIIRPSLVIGEGGEFLELARGWAAGEEEPYFFMPYFEAPRAHAKERTAAGISSKPRVQPVMVGDVASAFVSALDRDGAVGEVYPLGGPREFEWPEMLEAVREAVPGKTRPVWGVPAEVGEIAARAATVLRLDQRLPFCLSDVQMACEDNVCSNAKVQQELGVTPGSVSFAG